MLSISPHGKFLLLFPLLSNKIFLPSKNIITREIFVSGATYGDFSVTIPGSDLRNYFWRAQVHMGC